MRAATRAALEEETSPFRLCCVSSPTAVAQAGQLLPVSWLVPENGKASASVRLAADGSAEASYRLEKRDAIAIEPAAVLCCVRSATSPPLTAGGYFGLRETEADLIAGALLGKHAPESTGRHLEMQSETARQRDQFQNHPSPGGGAVRVPDAERSGLSCGLRH
eukprot:SAG31_NODE_661_length_13035_cov_12.057591_12_plen_163_part_00